MPRCGHHDTRTNLQWRGGDEYLVTTCNECGEELSAEPTGRSSD